MTAALDFATLPPEINSARMYSGAGSAPMLAAASAWHGLSAELRASALSYSSVLSTLTGEEWHGPASASMTAAAAPYVAWMSVTAVRAEQAGAQAEAAAAAYEAAFAATVPPPVIEANRAQLMALIATNARPKRPRDRGHRGPVRRNVVPGRDGHVRLRRRLGSRYPADPVHRAGADYQRVRPGGPVGCDCPRHRRLGWCSANDAVAADRRHTVCTARTFVIDCSHVRVGAVRIAGHSRVWIFLARQTLGVTGPQLQFLEHDSFVRTVLAE